MKPDNCRCWKTRNNLNGIKCAGLLLLAIVCALSYSTIYGVYLRVLIDILGLNDISFQTLVDEHYYSIDMVFCIIMIVVYLPIFGVLKIFERKKPWEPFGLQPMRIPHKVLFKDISIMTLGGAALGDMWIRIVDVLARYSSFWKDCLKDFNDTWDDSNNLDGYLFIFLSVILLGPIVEELLFRGIVFMSLEQAFHSGTVCIFGSAIAFGMWHGNVIQAVYASLFGVAIAVVYARTRIIWYAMLMHIVSNFLAYPPSFIENSVIIYVLLFIEYLCLIPAVMLCYKYFRHNEEDVSSGIYI